MRVFSVLYYTTDEEAYSVFIKSSERALNEAANRGTEVKLLPSFEKDGDQYVPLFGTISYLAQYLEQYQSNLADLTIIIDSKEIRRGLAYSPMRSIMIEYPEVKFLFTEDPINTIFKGKDIAEEFEEESLPICESCLSLLNEAINKSTNCIENAFLTSLEDDNSDIWVKIRGLLNIQRNDAIENIDKNKLIKSIRDAKCKLSRTCAKKHVKEDLLIVPDNGNDFYLDIVHTRDNLFDASNVRYAIKEWEYAHLRVNTKNFEAIQKSRCDNLAISVEEEHGQNRFNSYCLYANGFRVLPITCAKELKTIGDHISQYGVSIVVRDYDLQFFDTNSVFGSNGDSINLVRGFRDNLDKTWTIHLMDSNCWKQFYSLPSEYHIHYADEKTDTLSNGSAIVSSPCVLEVRTNVPNPVYFITKGTDKVTPSPATLFLEIDDKTHQPIRRLACRFIKEEEDVKLLLPGIQKPVSGVYSPFHSMPEIKARYIETRADVARKVDTTREGHDHGTALDVYSTVKSLLRRAEAYYERGKFIHAAVLANETIEYLNGFHESILLQAYHILALSENAIAMNIVGGDEDELKDDTLFRIEKIEKEVNRILQRKKKDDNDVRMDYKYNVLNQIYSECRKTSKEKEHFESEDCFISAMAHVREGFTLRDIRDEIILICKRIKKSWVTKKYDLKYHCVNDYD